MEAPGTQGSCSAAAAEIDQIRCATNPDSRQIAGQVAAAIRAGDTAEFYFVFAGHGDVDRGRGFLQLTDGAFDAGDLSSRRDLVHRRCHGQVRELQQIIA